MVRPIRVYTHVPTPQLPIGAQVRILYGKHQDKRGCVVSSVWDPETQVWLYYVKSRQGTLGEYPAEDLW
jgi:hypothetical protein